MTAERLQKILAQAGVASRRAAERYITDGRVKVNGKVVRELGAKADLQSDHVEVEGYGVLSRQRLVYIAMHKPANVVTTLKDPEGRPTVLTVLDGSRAQGRRELEGELPRVFPVGRLDFDAEGLVLLTNDGELANKLLHPRYHVPKTYMAKVQGRPEPRALERMRRGIMLREEGGGGAGRRTAPAEVRVSKQSPKNTWLEITIVEGRRHQVKLMCEAIGHSVIRLIRTEMGGVALDPLPAGAWRFLTKAEVAMLHNWTETARLSRARDERRR